MFILAPMEDVTDAVFRQVIARCGQPDLFFTEFTSVEGLCSPGRHRVEHRLRLAPGETSVIAQIWGQTPDNFHTVASELADQGFAGIDLNMGCPDKTVVKRGTCSALINNPALAAEIIAATKAGAGDLPVSVKTRCGLDRWVTEEWCGFLLHQDIAALTVHGRIATEMSHNPANWDEIARVVRLRDRLAPRTKLIGNGDVCSRQDGLDKIAKYGVDGVMIGRGIFHNPWFFNPSVDFSEVEPAQRLELLLHHVTLWDQTWGNTKHFEVLKKYFKMYTRDLPDASQIRGQLMELRTIQETKDVVMRRLAQ